MSVLKETKTFCPPDVNQGKYPKSARRRALLGYFSCFTSGGQKVFGFFEDAHFGSLFKLRVVVPLKKKMSFLHTAVCIIISNGKDTYKLVWAKISSLGLRRHSSCNWYRCVQKNAPFTESRNRSRVFEPLWNGEKCAWNIGFRYIFHRFTTVRIPLICFLILWPGLFCCKHR